MYRELNKKEWLEAMIKAQQKGEKYQLLNIISRIIQSGLDTATVSDLPALDVFYSYLPSEEGDNLKQFVCEKFDYVETECKIKKARIAAGLTQNQFSEIFEIPIDVVKSWDSGRRNPPEWSEKLILEKLEKIKNS